MQKINVLRCGESNPARRGISVMKTRYANRYTTPDVFVENRGFYLGLYSKQHVR